MRKLLLLICVAALGALGAAAATSYNINVGGVEVKSDNASNVTGGDIKAYDTSQSYSVTYSSSTNTLTLTNVKIGRSGSGDFCVHNRGCANLKIVFNGTCMLSSARAEAIKCEKYTTITVNGDVDCSGFGDRAIFLKSASLVLNGTGTLNVYGSGSGINGDSGNETVTTSLNKLTVNSANNAALKKLASFTVNPRNTSLVISTQVILQDPEESTQSSSAKYTESVTAVNFGSGVSVNKPMGATYNATNGFMRDGAVLKPSTDGGLVISDERDNPAYTTVGNYQYTVSGGVATLQDPTMAYRKTRPAEMDIWGYVNINGTLMPVKIAASAFENKMPEVKYVKIHYGVREIGARAFAGCSSLEYIYISSSVKSIGSMMIRDTDVYRVFWATLNPSSVTVYSNAFNTGNSNSRHMEFPTYAVKNAAPSSYTSGYTPDWDVNACDYINNYVCYIVTKEADATGTSGELTVIGGDPEYLIYTDVYCDLDSYTSVLYQPTSIAPYAFYERDIKSVNISPATIKTIGERAFSGCSSATTATIGSGVTSIGSNAFYGCTAVRTVNWNAANYSYSGYTGMLRSMFNSDITTVNIGSTVTSVPNYMCEGLTKLTEVSIPTSVKSIGESAFARTGISKVTLPSSLTNLQSYAIEACPNLKEVVIQSGLKSIMGNTFKDCTALQTVTIGSDVNMIAYTAFDGCTNINRVNWNAVNGPSASSANQAPFYASRANISQFTFGNAVKVIPPYLCNGFTKLTSVSLPSSVTSIGDFAFAECGALANVSFGNNLETIGKWAFQRCSALTKADLSATNLSSIGENAFAGCTGLTQLSLPEETLTTIGKQAFLGCSGLKKLALPEGVETLELGAFTLCTGLTTFSLPETVTSIGDMAFMNCTSLQDFYALPRCADIEMGSDVFQNASTASCTLHVKQGQLNAYKAADQWKEFFSIVGDQEDPDYNPNKFDVNNDDAVDVGDVNAVLAAILANNKDEKFNVNGDDDVDVGDVNAILEYILNGPSAKEYTVNGVKFKMISVKGGTFTMGATAEQGSDAKDNEKPTHQVTLSDFSIGETEVTEALWTAVMGSNLSSYKRGDNYPVENVSWGDCQTFIKKLNELTGETFRLPTEAEWEFAARGGMQSKGYKYPGSDTVDDVAWYSANSGSAKHPVATKAANELGLYDMSGNVSEWCEDRYGNYSYAAQTNPIGPLTGEYCVFRGGCWFIWASFCRVSCRNSFTMVDSSDYLGLRLAR